MKRLRELLSRCRLLKRLAAAEATASKLDATVDRLRFCQDCGGILLLGHPGAKIAEVAEGQSEVRCKWDQAAYERSPLHRKRLREAAEARTH